MKILKQIIEKKLENYRTLKKYSRNSQAYQERISAYLLCLVYLKLKDDHISLKKIIWKRYTQTLERKYLTRLLKYKSYEDRIILIALNDMDVQIEMNSQSNSEMFEDFTWAILSFEHEEGE